MSANFVHLHCHTEYSVLDGACKIPELLDKCQEFNMNSLAITDHGVLFGAVEFYKACKARGIKPIIGSELYVAREGRTNRTTRNGNYYHFLLLCKDLTGYHNLCKLSSLGYLEGFHYRPRVDDELLAKYSEGLIATTSCLAGEVPQWLMNGNIDKANEAIKKFIQWYGKDNFFVELMDHGLEDQKKVNEQLVELAEHHGLTLIATNDTHYVNKDDAGPHDALLCIQTNGMLDDEKRFRFDSDKFYFRSPDEMREVFQRWPEAVENTQKVADQCNLELPLGAHLIPQYDPPEGYTQPDYLRELVHAGLKERYGDAPDPKYVERADFELGVIEQMGFVDYFLVTWDLINFARKQGIPVGPGRGSGAGSIVAYALKITNIDPMMYGLLFERFLNPERVSMPDFDIDFCYERREEMIRYARQKYGDDNVCQIITFGRMLAKQVVRNVGRVLGMPYSDADRIAKLIPDELKISLEDAKNKVPELRDLIENDPQVKRLWQIATRLEGTIGNCGTHAAGVVICDHAITDHVALYQAAGTDTVATQAEMKALEDIGLLKMDFLGLRTLTVLHDAARLVRENHGVEIDIDNIPFDDARTYAVLRSGYTMGIFQLESAGMRDVAKRIGIESIEEVCALVALYRPGPMQFIDTYIQNKRKPAGVQYDHPLLEEILSETYGIAVYQEQVMQIVQAIAGFTLGQADIVRRAMGKKIAKLLAEQKEKFVEGAKRLNNIDKPLADKLWATIETFADYGFNKSHSMAYAVVAYQTAYMKAHYPAEFMAALLSSERNNLDKIAVYVQECRRMGIEVLAPDVNKSDLRFTVENGQIHFGLQAVKNVGEGPAEAIVEEREKNGPFKDIYDFCSRVESRQVNRRLIESLNKAGGFASTGWSRAQVEAALDSALSEAQISQRDRDAGQTSLLDMMGGGDAAETAVHTKPELPEWPEHELLAFEKEMLGLYVSSHPLSAHLDFLANFSTIKLVDLPELHDGFEGLLGGLVATAKKHVTAKGKTMSFMTVETLEGTCEVTVFADLYERCVALLQPDTAIMLRARVNYRNGEPGLIAEDIIAMDEAPAKFACAVHVRLTPEHCDAKALEMLARTLDEPFLKGACAVRFHCPAEDGREVIIEATDVLRVAPSPKLLGILQEQFGPDAAWLSAHPGAQRRPLKQAV